MKKSVRCCSIRNCHSFEKFMTSSARDQREAMNLNLANSAFDLRSRFHGSNEYETVAIEFIRCLGDSRQPFRTRKNNFQLKRFTG